MFAQSLIRYGYAWGRDSTMNNNPLDPATASARARAIPGITQTEKETMEEN